MKALVIGQAIPIPGVEIVASRTVKFPATVAACQKVLGALISEANQGRIALIFEDLPGQMAWAIAKWQRRVGFELGAAWAEGEGSEGDADGDENDVYCFSMGVICRNPQAMKFEFSHIEWL